MYNSYTIRHALEKGFKIFSGTETPKNNKGFIVLKCIETGHPAETLKNHRGFIVKIASKSVKPLYLYMPAWAAMSTELMVHVSL